MISKRREEMVVAVCLVGAAVIVALAPSVYGQVTVDWPVMNATPQQTRFTDIAAGDPPVGILWRYPYDGRYVSYPVLGEGMVFLRSDILDAQTGQCLHKFTDSAIAISVGEIAGQAYLFRCTRVIQGHIHHVTTSAYTYDPGHPSGPWVGHWSRSDEFTGNTARPQLNFSDGSLYLSGNSTGVIKIDASTGDEDWRVEVGARGPVAVGDVDLGGGTIKRLVITAGLDSIAAIDDRDGMVHWQQQYYAGQPALLPEPINKVVLPVKTLGKGNGKAFTWILCLDAANGNEVWIQQTGGNCWAWNGPVAVRYHDDGNGNATATIYATIGSGTPDDTDHPLYAFTLDGQDAWSQNPLFLPSGTISVPTATQDIVYIDLLDGSLYSVDAVRGNARGLAQFELMAGEFSLPIVVSNNGSYLLYDYSDRLGYMALAPEPTHNMAVMDISVPSQISAQTTSFDITVENIGNFEENVAVVLFIDDEEVSSWTSTYTPYGTQGSSQAFTYEWVVHDVGEHTVTATVDIVDGEVGIYDNTLSKFTILPDEYYTGPRFHQWLAVGRPACWCANINPRQCHGDADGKSQGKKKYWVSTDDLDILIAAWNKPFDEIEGKYVNNVPLICADFDHLLQGRTKYRVSTDDLDILIANWNIANKPDPGCP